MPPRGASKEAPSVSETEGGKQSSHGTSNSRASTKARNLAAQAAQAELLAKHIHSNGPQDRQPVDPLDFQSLPKKYLRKYRDHYNLPVQNCLGMSGFILGSELGKKTYSYKSRDRISKPELANVVKRHFSSQPVRESEIITNFLYKVNNQDKAFRLNFKN